MSVNKICISFVRKNSLEPLPSRSQTTGAFANLNWCLFLVDRSGMTVTRMLLVMRARTEGETVQLGDGPLMNSQGRTLQQTIKSE